MKEASAKTLVQVLHLKVFDIIQSRNLAVFHVEMLLESVDMIGIAMNETKISFQRNLCKQRFV